jgi:hypothetical protein
MTMKKFLPASLLAVALLAASQQKASAWFNFSVGASANLNLSWGGVNCGKFQSEPWPNQHGSPHGYSPYMPYGYPTHAGAGVQLEAAQPTPAPQPLPQAKPQNTQLQPTWYSNAAYQPVGYYYYTTPYNYYPSYSYSYYQTPAYWYGR